LALALALKLMQVVMGAARWGLVLAALNVRLRFAAVLRLFWIGAFWAQILPGAVGGDVARALTAARRDLTAREAVLSIVLEKALTLLGLSLFVAAVGGLGPFGLTQGLFGALAVGVVAVLGALAWADRWRRAPASLVWAAEATRRAGRRLGLWSAALALGLLGPANLALCAWALARGAGLAIDLTALLVVVPAATLVASLPISLAGWGVREFSFVAGLAMVGVPADAALALSLLYGVLGVLAALPGGVGLAWPATKATSGKTT
jgi:uncharacterized membrane protein YbhN (UPF0104 family)